MHNGRILIVGGYGEVGRRLAVLLEAHGPGRVIVGGRNPARAEGFEARRVDVGDPRSVDQALDGVSIVVACVRQREPHLLRAAVRRGIGYTSIAPPWLPWRDTGPLRDEAKRTGARVILAAGIEPGISSVLVRAAAERLGGVDAVESALLLSLGDAYGTDSMAFILDEITQPYELVVDGTPQAAFAFQRPKPVRFPPPLGVRRAYTIPFRDQLYYPATLGAKTAIARIALDPPWLGAIIAALLELGLRERLGNGAGRGAVDGAVAWLKHRYAARDRYALVVDVRGGDRTIRATVDGRGQAQATAVGVGAITEALWAGEVEAGVWLAEQAIAPERFFARLAAHGIVPRIEEVPAPHGPPLSARPRTTLAH
jgi:saccharopine dehydrogenase-like NADP-dependent oxidoreductase